MAKPLGNRPFISGIPRLTFGVGKKRMRTDADPLSAFAAREDESRTERE
jgi:hypothetical protein